MKVISVLFSFVSNFEIRVCEPAIKRQSFTLVTVRLGLSTKTAKFQTPS